MRMLVVDDEVDIANMLAEYFRMEGYDVTCANSGAEALAAASAGAAPDIMLLDVNMPGMDGFEVCRRVREHLSCPIIFLTARVEDVDQLDGFAAGADDYVMKPFSLEVLGRRVAAHMAREGRVRERENAVRFFRELTIDYGQRTVEVRPVTGEPGDGAVEGVGVEKPGSEGSHAKISDALEGSIAGGASACPSRTYVDLTKLEFDIIALLSKRPGQVFDRDAIYERVWGWDAAGDPSQVREHVRRIRNKLAAASVADDPIETVWGVGYKWVAK
ncbi:MAG: response regulator transcription factor [Collinsella sp.]|nr:response regulator transcription factor [Collinsella sp.]